MLMCMNITRMWPIGHDSIDEVPDYIDWSWNHCKLKSSAPFVESEASTTSTHCCRTTHTNPTNIKQSNIHSTCDYDSKRSFCCATPNSPCIWSLDHFNHKSDAIVKPFHTCSGIGLGDKRILMFVCVVERNRWVFCLFGLVEESSSKKGE